MARYRTIIKCFNMTVDAYIQADKLEDVKAILDDWLGINYPLCNIRIWNWETRELVYNSKGGERTGGDIIG